MSAKMESPDSQHAETTISGFSSPEATKVLIIGAGPTGLALGQGLKQAGISCIIVEKDESINARTRDWNMGMVWGKAALKSLIVDEMWDRLQYAQVDPSQPPPESDSMNFVNGKSGEVMISIPVQRLYRLRRSKLRELLAEGLDVRYGMSFDKIDLSSDTGNVTVRFEDGSSITAKQVVGSNGARSSVRQFLLGPERGAVRRLPYSATFIHSKYTREQALYLRKFHTAYIAAIHPDGYFSFFGMQDAADPDRPETWTFFIYISWYSSLEEQDATAHCSDAQRLAQVKEFSRIFTEPFRSALEWASADCPVWYMCMHYFDPGVEGHRWDNHGGRITLAGDAAHAMTYQRGQGLNHSLTDAARLCEAIKKFTANECTQEEAISSFEEEMIARAGGEARMSVSNTEMLHDWQRVMQSYLAKKGLDPHKGGS